MPVSQLLAQAIQAQQAGQLLRAEALYSQVLQLEPDHPQALHLQGVLAQQRGQSDRALMLIRKAIGIKPKAPACHNDLGNVLQARGELDAAIESFRQALALAPDDASVHYNLALALLHHGDPEQAVRHFRRTLARQPDDADAHYNLGFARQSLGQVDEAMSNFQRALALCPGYLEARNQLALLLQEQGQTDKAIVHYQTALKHNPGSPELHNNLGNAWMIRGQLQRAQRCFEQALALQPGHAGSCTNQANALCRQGQPEEAAAWYRRALDSAPERLDLYGAWLYALHYLPAYPPQQRFQAHADFARLLEQGTANRPPAFPPRSATGRRLRIGYLSPDFRRHSVAFFIEPVITRHDRRQFEVFCYYNHRQQDAFTQRLMGACDQWRTVAGLSDERLEQQIRQDKIDILVDLAGHTAYNRLPVFARKPAPVQVTWLGYPDTTGLTAMDYRITDGFADPPGMTEQFHTEQLIRLPAAFSCYQPVAGCPEVSSLPALQADFVTFGSFNNFAKVNARVIALWSRLLVSIPDACLLLKSAGLQEEALQQRVRAEFEAQGVAPGRLQLLGPDESVAAHFSRYHQVDIALDTFPYCGTTTSCDALWMGVPLITLAGDSHVSRVGVSQLSNLGLQDYIASSPDDYIAIAGRAACDLEGLSALRMSLRERMQASPLTDAAGLVGHLEAAYLDMWQRWCAC
jgi:predicted O-linked N-acetylglucosamine transferase (SPINDLY family)